MFQKQWDLLNKAAGIGKLPHAMLFFGQEKIGKKDFAVRFAKHLTQNSGINPDFILVEPENKNIQIKQIRDLIEKLSFKPYFSPCKAGVVNDAHLMNKESQNCFLKFLEEPAEKTHIILVTAFPYMLLPTILSRTQKIRFFPKEDFEMECKDEFVKDLKGMIKSDLISRFQYAKKKEDADLQEIFDSWTVFLRNALLGKIAIDYPLDKTKSLIDGIQRTKYLVSSTNANQKLALEILLMNL